MEVRRAPIPAEEHRAAGGMSVHHGLLVRAIVNAEHPHLVILVVGWLIEHTSAAV
jgi:hypothetical protein